MTTYRVKNWSAVYENDRSRQRDKCSWCAVPNKQDGLGYARIMAEPDGPAIYGCFVAMILIVSKQPKGRDGYLTVTGLPSDSPLTPADVTAVTRMPIDLVKRTLAVCSSQAVGWLDVVRECESGVTALPSDSPPTHRALPSDSPLREGIEEKEEKGMQGGGQQENHRKPEAANGGSRPRAPFDPLSVQIPERLDTERFRAAWADWCKFRGEIRKRLTETQVAQQLKMLEGLGPHAAVESIESSIAKGYQGLFAPKPHTGRNGRPVVTATAPAGQIPGFRLGDY